MGIKSLRWVKRIGAVAGLAASAFVLGKLNQDVAEDAVETTTPTETETQAEGQTETTEQTEQTTAKEEVPE